MFRVNYQKPGRGVDKPDPNKPRIVLFFELVWRKLWLLVKVNVLYLLACIPAFLITMILAGLLSGRITDFFMPILAEFMDFVSTDMSNPRFAALVAQFDILLRFGIAFLFMVFLGMGPATAGFTYILRNFSREEHSWILSDFRQHTKANFRQSLLIWIIDLLAFCILVIAFNFYSEAAGVVSYLKYIILFIGIVYVIMHFYVYQNMVTFKLTIKDLFKNSLIFAFAEAPKNLAILAVLVFVHVGIPYLSVIFVWPAWAMIAVIVAELLFTVAAMGFMTNFFIYPTTEKYIKMASDDGDESFADEKNEEL